MTIVQITLSSDLESYLFGWVNINRLNFSVSGPQFINSSNVGVDNAVFRLSISLSVPEIFAIEV